MSNVRLKYDPEYLRAFDWRQQEYLKSVVAPEGSTPVEHDPVEYPAHYTWLPKGIEVIDITENFNFTLGNALKYIMRSGRKGAAVEDLKKAIWYLQREIARIEGGSK